MGGLGGMGPTVVGVTLLEMFLALAFVATRTWARIRLFSGMRADDYWLWAAMVMLIAFTAVAIGGAYRGLGQHNDKLTDVEQIKKLSKLLFTYACIFPLSVLTSKAAVATFLLMIVVKKTHKIIIYSSMAIVAILCLLEFIGLFVQCFPVYSNWNPFITDKVCHFNVTAVGYTLAGYGTFLDFFLAALPWFFLRNLQIKRRERLTITLSLSAGVLAGICGLVRLQQLVALGSASDRNYQFAAPVLWSSTELTVSIVCTCLPATRTLYRRYVKGLASSMGDSTTGGRTGGRRTRGTGGMYTLNDRSGNGNGVTVTGGAASVGGGLGGVGGSGRTKANGSDESILGDEFRMQNVRGIKQTTNVVVEFEDGDSRKEDGATNKSVEVV